MAKYRTNLPQLAGDLFLTDGGLETTMLFHEGFDLPHFAVFPLLEDEKGQEAFKRYFHKYCGIASKYKVGFILEAVTWRASIDWATKLGYSKQGLDEILYKAVEYLIPYREQYENELSKYVISSAIGPRGDGYSPEKIMTADEAEDYHSGHIETLAKTETDMLTAFTLNYSDEAIGISRAAKTHQVPVVLSFTLETNGKLPTGQSLKNAIQQVEDDTDNYPSYYKINCAHPSHFEKIVATGEPWLKKIRSLRANASKRSHAELNEAEELDEGNPEELGNQYRQLREYLPNLNVLGGCCGTDHRHIEAICKACVN
ncbi:MAG: homocysteine S-methyltransferase family protein [Gammaproteobacteria bacterium]|nr:homocysteine S-methyltransferase family protein [Gammaproteobacteria bacterium]